MLSCDCNYDFDESDFGEWYDFPEDFSRLETIRRRRCRSCNDLIDVGSLVCEFPRWRWPRDDVEEAIFGIGCELRLASIYYCEACGEIFLNLSAIGYCMELNDSMTDCMKKYQEIVKQKKLDKTPKT